MPTVSITAPADDAPALARTLVEERLAACVNRVPCESTYRWEGEVVESEEVILLAKTTDERFSELVERIETDHPHETPCIERFDEESILPAFADWVADST